MNSSDDRKDPLRSLARQIEEFRQRGGSGPWRSLAEQLRIARDRGALSALRISPDPNPQLMRQLRQSFGLSNQKKQSPKTVHAVHRPKKPKRGRPPETGYANRDARLFGTIAQMIDDGAATSPTDAAKKLVAANQVAGFGTPENKARRLRDRYNDWRRKNAG